MNDKKDPVDSPSLKNTEISIILPVLNEEENILPLLTDIQRELSGSKYNVCIIDDGSKDHTMEIIDSAIRDGHPIHLIRREKKSRGSQRGSALVEGMQWGLANTDAEIFIEIDGDRSHRPEELADGIGLIRSKKADVALASKYVPGSKTVNRTFGRRCISYLANFFIGFCLDSKINDYSNGYRFYSRKAAEELADSVINYGSPIYLTEAMAIWLRRGMKIKEFPTTYVGRGEGLSKLRWTDIFKAIIGIMEISIRFHISGFSRKQDRISEDAQKTDEAAWNSRAVLLAAICSAFLFIIMVFFGPHPLDIDTLGLYNPVYTFLHFGKMAYPAYGYPDFMIIHPPIHYYSIAILMMLGVGANFAFYTPAVLLFLVCVFAIVSSPFRPAIRCGGLLAIPTTLFLFSYYSGNYYNSIRPDLTLALAWFAGLIFLESARIEGYNTRKLFLGAILISYASILNYFAFPAFFAIIVYAIAGAKDLGYRAGRIKAAALVVGAGIIMIPYLFGWVVPYWSQIIEFVNSATVFNGGLFQGFLEHLSQYQAFLSLYPMNSLPALLIWPVVNYGLIIPLWIWIPLALYKKTRILSIACLPMLLYVAIMSRKSAGYFYPELFLYYSVVLAMIFLIFDNSWNFGQRFKIKWQFPPQMLSIAVIVIFISCLWNNPNIQNWDISIKDQWNEMDLARASAQQMVGTNAFIGGRIADWYIGGGTKWHDISSDILWRKDPIIANYSQYFEQFDYIEEHNHMSEVTLNRNNETLGSLYIQNYLKIKGFYFSSNNIAASYLILSPHPNSAQNLEGYIYTNQKTLLKFSENVNGNYNMIISITDKPVNILSQKMQLPYTYLNLPKSNSNLDYLFSTNDTIQHYLLFVVMDKTTTDLYLKDRGTSDNILEIIPGVLKYEDPETLLANSLKSDKNIIIV